MRIEQRQWTVTNGWESQTKNSLGGPAQLALMFGATSVLKNPALVDEVKKRYPAAHVVGCSTAGEICGTRVLDDSLTVTAVNFEHTEIKGTSVKLAESEQSFDAGRRLAAAIPLSIPAAGSGAPLDLAHVLVFADGLQVNGSELVRGLTSQLPEGVTVTGGMEIGRAHV